MPRHRHRQNHIREEGTSFLERVSGAFIGATAAAVIYISLQVLALVPIHGPDRWSIAGPLKWCVAAGAVLGFLLGLSFARWLWSFATDQFEFETSGWGVLLVVLVIFIAIVVLAIKFTNAA
jgi:hypothetical protein